jgi:hypothetical protein
VAEQKELEYPGGAKLRAALDALEKRNDLRCLPFMSMIDDHSRI